MTFRNLLNLLINLDIVYIYSSSSLIINKLEGEMSVTSENDVQQNLHI